MYATHRQELLLKAALLAGEPAVHAWQNWQALVDFEQQLDIGSFRLLPLLYHNLRNLGVDDPIMSRLKGIYRREWYKNQVMFHAGAKVLQTLHAADINTMILKGAALTVRYYQDYGLRPMGDFDVLVPIAKHHDAIRVLTDLNWQAQDFVLEKLTEEFKSLRHAYGFRDRQGHELDLHWYAIRYSNYPQIDDDFWLDAIPAQIGDITTCMLNPTDQLLHTVIHGMAWNSVPSIRWIADAVWILNADYANINWQRLISQAEKRRLTILPLFYGLSYLRDTFDMAIPDWLLTKLKEHEVTDIERKLFNAAMNKSTLLGRLPYHWYLHLFHLATIDAGCGFVQKCLRFPEYIFRYTAKGQALITQSHRITR